jgi:ribosomal protein S18 acetylase RimI-like enzyme
VRVDPDTAAQVLTGSWEYLASALPEAWTHRERGALAVATMVPLATLNGVWTDRVDPDPEVVDGLLARLAGQGLPHCIQLRPGSDATLAELASKRGMVRDEEIPLMVLEDPRGLIDGEPEKLAIRKLRPERVQVHAQVAAAGFEAPEEHFRQMMVPELLGLPGVRCYVGEVDGEPVTTGLGVTRDDAVGIFNIATPPAQRRRGYGAAVTARAVRDGFANGARWAWLQSSAPGYAVYERLGFRTLESWPCWVNTA